MRPWWLSLIMFGSLSWPIVNWWHLWFSNGEWLAGRRENKVAWVYCHYSLHSLQVYMFHLCSSWLKMIPYHLSMSKNDSGTCSQDMESINTIKNTTSNWSCNDTWRKQQLQHTSTVVESRCAQTNREICSQPTVQVYMLCFESSDYLHVFAAGFDTNNLAVASNQKIQQQLHGLTGHFNQQRIFSLRSTIDCFLASPIVAVVPQPLEKRLLNLQIPSSTIIL